MMKRSALPLFLLLTIAVCAARAQTFTFVDAYFDDDALIDGLDFVFATAVSPDGLHVYACGGNGGNTASDNAVVVFSRDASGRLSFVEAQFDDDDATHPGSADGLFSCRDVIVSNDGKHVYTAGFSDNAVGIFLRNQVSGELTFDSVVEDGVGLDGLAGVESIALSPDGSALFAVGSIDDALVAFSRNSTTGALSFEDSARNGLGGVNGLDRPLAVAVSGDGQHVYTAAGSNENFTGSDAVAAFGWNAGLGDLTFLDAYFEGAVQGVNTIDGVDRVSSVMVSSDGRHVYATGGLDSTPAGDRDWIAVFSRSESTGELSWSEAVDDFNFCAFDILFGFETYAVMGTDDTRIFVTSPRTAVVEFSRNPTTGSLTFADAECLFDSLSGSFSLGINLPRKLSLDPTGSHFYVPGNADNAVAAFDADGIFTDGFESGDVSAWSSSLP